MLAGIPSGLVFGGGHGGGGGGGDGCKIIYTAFLHRFFNLVFMHIFRGRAQAGRRTHRERELI